MVLSGGCFGKIYKCVKRSIINYRRKQNESKWSSQIESRKFLFQLVMTQNEKRNPNIPVALRARDRGWLFVPKWVFLPYLRLLDRCICLTANQQGLQIYGSNLIKVSTLSQNVSPVISRAWTNMFVEMYCTGLTHNNMTIILEHMKDCILF